MKKELIKISSNLLNPNNLKTARDTAHLISQALEFLRRFDGFNEERMSRLLYFDKLFYSLTDARYGIYTIENITKFITGIKNLLNFDEKGFMDLKTFEGALFLQLAYTIYPELRKMSLVKRGSSVTLLNLTHVYNFCLLIMIKEIYLLELELPEDDDRTELFYDLLETRNQLIGKISSGLRKVLVMKRYNFIDRMVSGFDTEFLTKELGRNELLASTVSVYPRLFLKIKKLQNVSDIHWGYNDFNSKTPVYSLTNDIYSIILFIRFLKGSEDDVINNLVTELKKLKGTKIDYFDDVRGHYFCIKKEMTPDNFINIYTNHTQDPKEYSLKFLVKISLLNSQGVFDKEYKEFLDILDKLGLGKAVINQSKIRFPDKMIDFSRSSELTLIAHFSSADISTWSDYPLYKDKLKILGKTYITLGRSLKVPGLAPKIELRDTMLLTPIGTKSLSAIGALYSDPLLQKIELPKEGYLDMKSFMNAKPKLFREYAIRDAVITLYHGLKTEESCFSTLKTLSIPISLSSTAGNIIADNLDMSRFSPDVINPLYSLKDIARIMTPIGVELAKEVALYIPYFLGSYHGGRNESFAYGIFKGEWYDLDVPGAYPTAMSLLNYPSYKDLVSIPGMSGEELISQYNLLTSYSSFHIEFSFPKHIIYPNLPVRLDGGSIIFPSTGKGFCTGLEILLAVNLGATVEILSGYLIPFVNDDSTSSSELKIDILKDDIQYKLDEIITEGINKLTRIFKDDKIDNKIDKTDKSMSIKTQQSNLFINQTMLDECRIEREAAGVQGVNNSVPLVIGGQENETLVLEFQKHSGFLQSDFFKLMKHWTEKRKLYPRNTYNNLFYKFLANSGIGQLARGLSRKPTFDPSSNSAQPIPASKITNPLYAGWVTAFIRCIVSELMNQLHEKGYKIISVTTDGFITDCPDTTGFEKLLFSSIYSQARLNLCNDGSILECKYKERKGVISWSTRGQLGIDSKLKAATGFQVNSLNRDELVTLFEESFKNRQIIHYLQFSLRSAKDIFKYGGSVTGKYQEKDFKLVFDNRREISCIDNLSGDYEGFISEPWNNVESCKLARFISKMGRRKYSENSFLPSQDLINDKSSYHKMAVRMLIRAFYHSESIFDHEFTFVIERKFVKAEMMEFGIDVTLNYISKQKQARFVKNAVPQVKKTIKLISRVKEKYPYFKEYQFFKDFKYIVEQDSSKK